MQLLHVLYEPAGSGPHPTIVALHGLGASALDLVGLAPLLGAGKVQMICPQGPLTVPIAGGAVGFGWFPLSGGQLTDPTRLSDAASQLREFLDTATSRYAIHPRKLVLLGFSQGGVLAYRVALRDPARFAALVALSSWLPPPLVADLAPRDEHRHLATLVQHGTADGTIAVARAHQSVETLRGLHVPVTYREYPMGHEISPASLRDLAAWLEEKVFSPVIVS